MSTVRFRGMGVSAHDIPKQRCPDCGDTFFTRVGLEAHIASGNHARYERRWVHGRYSVAGFAAMQARGRDAAAENNARRRRCSCGRVSTPPGLALHQASTGHQGWTELPPDAGP